jgi:hypothetical protein
MPKKSKVSTCRTKPFNAKEAERMYNESVKVKEIAESREKARINQLKEAMYSILEDQFKTGVLKAKLTLNFIAPYDIKMLLGELEEKNFKVKALNAGVSVEFLVSFK